MVFIDNASYPKWIKSSSGQGGNVLIRNRNMTLQVDLQPLGLLTTVKPPALRERHDWDFGIGPADAMPYVA
jgi:hypothetical protein